MAGRTHKADRGRLAGEATKTGDRRVKRNIITMWISSGPDLRVMQRLGYAFFSLFPLAFGLAFLIVTSDSWRSGSFVLAVVWGFWSAILILIGFGGLFNVLRFRRGNRRTR